MELVKAECLFMLFLSVNECFPVKDLLLHLQTLNRICWKWGCKQTKVSFHLQW